VLWQILWHLFKQSTILTIAHRISTVLDYDRIMVLSEGHLVEFDTPANLLANKDSYFFGLVSSNMLDQQQQPQQGTETETD
jgi:ABC-type multidrug transport system fused ATPase/permease subunit